MFINFKLGFILSLFLINNKKDIFYFYLFCKCFLSIDKRIRKAGWSTSQPSDLLHLHFRASKFYSVSVKVESFQSSSSLRDEYVLTWPGTSSPLKSVFDVSRLCNYFYLLDIFSKLKLKTTCIFLMIM